MHRLFSILLLCLISVTLLAEQTAAEQNETLKIVVISDLNGSYGSATYHKVIP